MHKKDYYNESQVKQYIKRIQRDYSISSNYPDKQDDLLIRNWVKNFGNLGRTFEIRKRKTRARTSRIRTINKIGGIK